MLAEIFFLRLEATARATKEATVTAPTRGLYRSRCQPPRHPSFLSVF